jgi:hypothetical protein
MQSVFMKVRNVDAIGQRGVTCPDVTTEVASLIVGGLSLTAAVAFGIGMAWFAWRANRAASAAAVAAKASAEAARETARVEQERLHDELAPRAVHIKGFVKEVSRSVPDLFDVYLLLENTGHRAYNVTQHLGPFVVPFADTRFLPAPLLAGATARLFVSSSYEARPKELTLLFDGLDFQCLCERKREASGSIGISHWSRIVSVPPEADWQSLVAEDHGPEFRLERIKREEALKKAEDFLRANGRGTAPAPSLDADQWTHGPAPLS